MPTAVLTLSRLLALALAASLVFAASAAVAHESHQTVPVKRVQRALGVTADGIAGPQTRRALRRFQRANGLRVTGRADAATLAALGLTSQQRSLSGAGAASVLAKIAECESGGDPTAVSPDGRYRGKYQFSRATWRGLGGSGDPARADEATQDAMALKLYQQRGTAPWPACSAKLD